MSFRRNTYAPATPPVLPPKKFRRKERVYRVDHKGDRQLGTVLNPSHASSWNATEHHVSVRFDSMQPWENGHVYRESDLTSDTTGETQFERRMYDMRFLKHDDIAAIRRALAADGNADALIVLSKTPELPE